MQAACYDIKMDWRILAVVAPLLFVSYQTLSKLFPKDVSVFLINAYASAIGTIVMLILFFLTTKDKSLALGSKYLPLAVGIGVLISFGNAAVIKAYGLGAPQSAFTGTFYPLLIVYGLIFGLLFWHERLNWYQSLGIALVLIGMFLIIFFKR